MRQLWPAQGKTTCECACLGQVIQLRSELLAVLYPMCLLCDVDSLHILVKKECIVLLASWNEFCYGVRCLPHIYLQVGDCSYTWVLRILNAHPCIDCVHQCWGEDFCEDRWSPIITTLATITIPKTIPEWEIEKIWDYHITKIQNCSRTRFAEIVPSNNPKSGSSPCVAMKVSSPVRQGHLFSPVSLLASKISPGGVPAIKDQMCSV